METLVNFRTKWMYIIGMVLFLPLFGGCQESIDPDGELRCQVVAVEGTEEGVEGKWKLVKGEVFSSTSQELLMEDYSCNNIFYQFNYDGKLVINSDLEDYIGHKSGEYMYEIIMQSGVEFNLLKMDNQLFFISHSTSDMTIGVNPINPLVLYESELKSYFVRIQ
jgi:hypothetical protein